MDDFRLSFYSEKVTSIGKILEDGTINDARFILFNCLEALDIMEDSEKMGEGHETPPKKE